MTFLEVDAKYNYSPDIAEKDIIAIYLKPFETYRQVFNIGSATDVEVKLFRNEVESSGLFFKSEIFTNKKGENFIFLDFLIADDFHSDCLRLSINGKKTNPFVCSKDDLEFTSLLTYWHRENIEGIPFIESNYKPLQIRLPIYFKTSKTEEDSEEYVTNFRLRENVRRSRVKRVFKSVWNVDANNWLNERIAIVSDCDFVYINSVRQISTPFVFNETDSASAFVISEWETQPRKDDIISIGLIGGISVDSHTLNIEFDRDTEFYCVNDFWHNYFHALGIPREKTYVVVYNSEKTGKGLPFSYNEVTDECFFKINLKDETRDSFTQEIIYKIIDDAGNESNFATLTLVFKRSEFHHYSPKNYNQNKYA